MNYPEALEYLFSLQSRGIKLDLSRMRDCLEALGRPQDAFDSILVAGTNGKGSTASILASLLSEPGREIGLFTSPHLLEYRERIRIDGRLIDRDILARQVEADHTIWERFELTFFEATAALALSIFRHVGIEIAVLEIGLGGRLDATNVVDPVLSVITQIGRDHVHILGDDLAGIAREKAGILRPDVPVAIAGGIAKATGAIAERAATLGSPLFDRARCLRVRQIRPDGEGTRFELARRESAPEGFHWPDTFVPIRIGMPGVHQVANATLAILAAAIYRGDSDAPDDRQLMLGADRWR